MRVENTASSSPPRSHSYFQFVKENCTRWKLDPERLVISGESGGGYIVFGTMVMLAQRKEANLVKAAFPIIPMMSDYFFSDPASMTIEERFNQESMKVMWTYIAKVGGGSRQNEIDHHGLFRT